METVIGQSMRDPHKTTRGQPMKPQGTELRVCEDIQRRQVRGIQKYGVTVEQSHLASKEWLQHAYEEALDLAIYLKRAIEGMEEAEIKVDDWIMVVESGSLCSGINAGEVFQVLEIDGNVLKVQDERSTWWLEMEDVELIRD